MRRWKTMVASAMSLAVAACVSHTRPESAALPMPWPKGPDLAAYARSDPDYPSIGGDILKGYSPEDLAAARAAATQNPPDKGH